MYTAELKSDHNLVFFGHLNPAAGRRALCIKFTHQYGEEVHRICAAIGYAPKLHTVQRLPGSFFMVVMDDVGEDYVDLQSFIHEHPEIVSSSTYTDLKENI